MATAIKTVDKQTSKSVVWTARIFLHQEVVQYHVMICCCPVENISMYIRGIDVLLRTYPKINQLSAQPFLAIHVVVVLYCTGSLL